ISSSAPRYDAEISATPLELVWNRLGPVKAQVNARLAMEKDRLTISSATVKTAGSEVQLSNGLLSSFTSPVATAQYKARLSLAEADSIFKLVNFRHAGTINVSGDVRYASLR